MFDTLWLFKGEKPADQYHFIEKVRKSHKIKTSSPKCQGWKGTKIRPERPKRKDEKQDQNYTKKCINPVISLSGLLSLYSIY